ncbi:MAG: MEDS domain-containing protein [Gemmatimonadales bacterium]
MADANELLDIGQAAEFLRVSETSLRRWTNAGKLGCLRIGQKRERRFRKADLLAFMESQPGNAGGSAGRAGLDTGRRGPSFESGGSHPRHSCSLYSTDAGCIEAAVPFLLDGLQEGSVCYLVGGPRVRDGILEEMIKRRASVSEDVESGKLILSNYHKSPRQQWEYFAGCIAEAVSKGATSFRAFGDVWALLKKTSAETVVEYEYGYGQLISARFPIITLCGYDARRFDGEGLLSALRGHPETLRRPLAEALT